MPEFLPTTDQRPIVKTLFAMTVDTEEEWSWGAEWPTGGLSVTNIRNLPRFQQLCSRYNVPPTYFVNQAVLNEPGARDTVLNLSRWGRNEIGMHIHPWNTPPLRDGNRVPGRETFLHNLDGDVIEAKLESVYGSFEQCGLKPTSFRGGRYSSGGRIHEFLQNRSFIADSSVVPFTTWDEDGAPDYRDRDLLPVRRPPRTPDGVPLWEIPLTRGFTRGPQRFWARCYRLVESTWLRRLRLIGLADRTGLVRRAWLNFEDTPVEVLLDFLRRLRYAGLPCLCLTIHSSSLMAGPGPYTKTPADEQRVFDAIDRVFGELNGWPEFQSATMSEIASILEERHHARARN